DPPEREHCFPAQGVVRVEESLSDRTDGANDLQHRPRLEMLLAGFEQVVHQPTDERRIEQWRPQFDRGDDASAERPGGDAGGCESRQVITVDPLRGDTLLHATASTRKTS